MRGVRAGSAARAGLLLVLVTAAALPWALGGTPMWAYRPAAFLLVTGFSLTVWSRGLRTALGGREAAWLWPALALAAVALLQSVPLSTPVVGLLSPHAADAWARSVPSVDRMEAAALAAVPETAGVPIPAPGRFPFAAPPPASSARATVSYAPGATRERLVWFAALLASFLVVRQGAATREGRGWVRNVVLANLALLAVAALAFRAFRPGAVYGWIAPLRGGNPYGPYVNPSHFAFLMELAVPWLVGLAWHGYRKTRVARSAPVALPAAGAVLCVFAAYGSASKGTAILVPLSLAVLWASGATSARRGRRLLPIAAAVLLGAAALLVAAPVRERMQDFVAAGGADLSRADRILIWRHSVELIASHPILGTGFGAFRYVIPRVQPAGETAPWHQLHNDYLEVVVGGGAVGALLVVVLIWSFARRAFEGVRSDRPIRLERMGILTGIGAVSAHALFDFAHQMPANALLFVVAAALVAPGRGGGEEGSRPVRRVERAAALVAAALVGAFAAQGIPAGANLGVGVRAAARGDMDAAQKALDRASVGTDRFEALWLNGDVRLGVWDRMASEVAHGANGARTLEAAAGAFLDAEREVAASGWTLQGLGSTYRRAERADAAGRAFDLSWITASPWAAVGRFGRVAVGLHRLAVEREPMVAPHRDALIVSLLELGLRAEALAALREAARLQPILVQHQGLDSSRLDDQAVMAFHEGAKEALGSVPLTPPQRHLLSLGQTAFRLRRYEEAESWLHRALDTPADRISKAEARFWLALTAQWAGRPHDARRWYESVADIPNFREASLANLASLAKERGDAGEELALRDRLRKEYAANPFYLVQFAEAAIRSGRASTAVEPLRAARLRYPGDVELGLSLAEALLASGDAAGARRELDRLERRTPGDPRVTGLRERIEASGKSVGPAP